MASNRRGYRGSILQLEVPLIVRLGSRQMTVREVVSIVPGTIIELPKNAEEELELLVNNHQIGRGRAVKVGENFGVRITALGAGASGGSPGSSAGSDGGRTRSDASLEEVEFAERLLADQF